MKTAFSTPWYREAFQEGYLDLYGHRDLAEAARAILWLREALGLRAEQRVLDLCCGPGRHLFFLGQLVREAIGLDLSDVLLHGAREHWNAGQSLLTRGMDSAAETGGRVWDLGLGANAEGPQPPRLVRATMSRLPFAAGSFDCIVNLFTSFGYYEDEARNMEVLRGVTRALRPGGRFALDHINRAALLAALRPQTERRLPNGREVREERQWDAAAQRVIKTVSTREPDGSQRGWRESVRVYEPAELEGMLDEAGLRMLARHGDYAGGAWTPDAPRLILLARKEE